jgi:hypothetical protein
MGSVWLIALQSKMGWVKPEFAVETSISIQVSSRASANTSS